MAIRYDPAGNEIKALTRAVDLSGRQVLEVGCGDGRLTFRYAHLTRQVYAVDPERKSIAAARRHTPAHLHRRVEFHQGSAEHLNLPR